MARNISVGSIHNKEGFSLIELMIALAIFSVAMLAIASAQISTINANAKSRLYSEAATIAQNQVETLMNTKYDTISNGGTAVGRYAVTWTVDAEVDSTRTVHMTVGWTVTGGGQKAITTDFVVAAQV